MTLYLQNTTDSHYIFDYSTTQIFNTEVGSKGTSFTNTKDLAVSWYLHPVLAGDLHVEGDITLWAYLNYSGTNPNANIQFTIKEISYKLDAVVETVVWSDTSTNQGITLETGINSFSTNLAGMNHVFAAGNSIGIEFDVSGGQGIFRTIWFGNSTYDTRIEFESYDYLEVGDVSTLNYLDEPTINYQFDLPNKTVKMRANLTDPFGGYDIYDVRLTLKDPSGTIIIDNQTMTLINGTPISYNSVYETQWDYTGADDGRYNVTIWAVDNNGHNYYEHREQYNYDGYERFGLVDFWIGGLPANFNVRVFDSLSNPLPGATVEANRGGKIVSAVTGTNGTATIGLYPALYTIKVFWEDVEVASEDVTVTDGGAVDITAAVYYPTIQVVDANGDPLAGASVIEVHPNGTVFLSPWITDSNGSFPINLAPGGTYRFLVKWQDVEVANELVNINGNGVFIINAQVFTLSITIQDSHSVALPGAQVVIIDDQTRIVFDSKLTNLQGRMTSQLPVGVYDINIFWAETDVGGQEDYALSDNADLVINCDVYYVTVETVDSRGLAVSDASVMILSSVTGSLMDSGRTNDLGLTTLRLPMGIHDFQVHWREIMVATGSGLNVTGDILPADPYTIVVQVHYTAIKVVDSKDEPLPAALVTVTTQGGGVFDFQQTSGNGTCVIRVPLGTHVILVQWKGMDVAKETNFTVTGDIPISDPFVVKASVYYMMVKVLDSRDNSLPNAVVTIYHQNGETADSGLTNIDGETVIRLPASTYDLVVFWKDVEVGTLLNQTFNSDGTVTINAAVYLVLFKTLDIRQIPVNKAVVTVYYKSGDVMDSGTTDDAGEVFFKLPGTAVDVAVAWKGAIVGNLTDKVIDQDGVIVIDLQVFYLTVRIEGADGESVGGVEVTVTTAEGGTFDAGRTRSNGKAEFRVAKGDYNVTIRFTTTYMLSSVYEKQVKPVTVDGDETVKFTLDEYPPPIYTTVAFGVTLATILLIVIIMAVFTYFSKKLKQAAISPRDPEILVPSVGEPAHDDTSSDDGTDQGDNEGPKVLMAETEPVTKPQEPPSEAPRVTPTDEPVLTEKQEEVEAPVSETEPGVRPPRTKADEDRDIERELEDL